MSQAWLEARANAVSTAEEHVKFWEEGAVHERDDVRLDEKEISDGSED